MTDPIRLGVIGTSWWADLQHLPAFVADERVNLVAICGRNRERAQTLATKHGIPQVFTDYQAMIAEGKLQAIAILTPDDQHFAMTMAALDAGLHVLCEKPLARHAAEAQQLYEFAEAQGVRHMTYFTNRWYPHYRYLHDLIAQGTVGRLYHLQINFMAGFALSPHYAWRYDPQRASGVIGDLGSHAIDMARYLVGDIARVNARLVTNVQRNGTDGQPMASACDAATVWVEFVDGSQGTIEVNSVARTHDPAFEHEVILHGAAGSLTASFGIFSSPPKLEVARGNEGYRPLAIPEEYLQGLDPAQSLGPQQGRLFGQSPNGGRGFVDAILTGQTVAPSFYEGWQAQRVLDAALASHARGSWVDV